MPDLAEFDQPPTPPTDGPPTGDDRLELLEALDRNEDLAPRQRTTNTLTWVLVGLLGAGAVFLGGAWFQRTFGPAPATTTGTAGGAAAAFAAAVRSGGLPAGVSLPTLPTLPTTVAAAGATRGTVKLVDGTKVYVAKADGTIVIVTTNASTAVQVAAPGTLGDLTAGQSVTVQGATQADGTLAASEIVGTTTG